jgi:phosphotransferase system, enzyme I, PtsP
VSMATPGWGGGVPTAPERRPPEHGGARRLLRRMIELMAAPVTPEERLDRIVGMIAADIVAEVCSVYVRRAGDILELFATQGLRSTAVHQTRLRVGEGLVGLIAAQGRVLNTSDARSHPDFAFRPETGEEIYNSFLGVPMVRGGQVAGVLVVQNRAQRRYAEDEVEALEVVASLLGEMLASGSLVDTQQYGDLAGVAAQPRQLEGVSLVPGIAMGEAVLHRRVIEVPRLLAEDPATEVARLDTAIGELRAAVDELVRHPDITAGETHDVLESYRMFAHDHGWLRRMREAIHTGLTAEAAARRVQEETRLRLGQVSDAYMRERLLDLDDLANRLLMHLSGHQRAHDPEELPESFILVARALGPAELLEYDRTRLGGVILEEGSPTAHVTILARALDIPMVGRIPAVMTAIDPGDLVGLDGDSGHVFVRPGEDVELAFAQSLAARAERRRHLGQLRDLPSVTADGIRVGLSINAAFPFDLAQLATTGADGVGLYRTELAFMTRARFPDVETQTELYARILDQVGARPIVFRTLDVGSDKHLPYWTTSHETNPAMGWRAMRMVLDRPSVLRAQLRALLRACAGRPLSIMFPMVAEVAELDAARGLLELEQARASARGEPPPERVEVGTMLEVPALYWQLPALLERIDFLSVGSNDLLQFLFACDRGNPALIDRYDVLSPAFLRFLHDLVRRCRRAGVRLSICGEMASRPLEAMALVGVGLRHLSLIPTDVAPVKAMLRSLQASDLADYLAQLYDLPDHSLRGRLHAYAMDHDVHLDPVGAVAA